MVLDIMLPDIQGFEVAERLGAQRAACGPADQRAPDLPETLVAGQYQHKTIPGGVVIKGLAELQPEGPWRYRLLVVDHMGRKHRSNWLDMKSPSEVRTGIDAAGDV